MRISLFGNLRIEVAGRLVTSVHTNRLQSLIAYLILHGDSPQPRDKLAFTLWPASRESQARTNLRQLLHSLKRALPPECDSLVIDHFAVRWRQDPSCIVDVYQFQAALAEADAAGIDQHRARQMQCLTTAAQFYEDDILPPLYDDWLQPLREEFRNKMCHALYRLATLLEEGKEYAAAIPYTDRLLVLDPLGEPYHQLLIRLHAANHDRAGALRAYHQCMRVLRREMGVEPGSATKELFERILKGDADHSGEPASGSMPLARTKPSSYRQELPAIVGRSTEWDRITKAWQLAVDNGAGVVLISGEPGIGKTRLADELYRWCLWQGQACARSRCYAGQGQAAYAPVAEWLLSDAVRAGWAKLRPQQLTELARLAPQISEEFPRLELARATEANPLPEKWQRLLFYESLHSAIEKSRKPILLYMDDMQWCDSDSLEWLSAFLNSPGAAGVLVLGTVRSEETGREHPFTRFVTGLRQSGLVEEIPLERLSVQETGELALCESGKPVEGRDLEEIFRTTRGNPLFVLESVRSGSQRTRLHAVITARLADLPGATYELAGLASVLGRPFSLELLATAIDWDERSVSDALDELWRRKIIESRGSSEYDFSHDLVREVAYSELSLVRKRYLHRQVARALAEVHSGELESWHGQIASHFQRAGMPDEAIESLQRAADRARQRYADKEAADLLRSALALCRDFSQSEKRAKRELDLILTLGPVLVTTEGYSALEVGERYDRALEICGRLQDRSIFVVLSGAWLFNAVRGNLETARQVSLEFLRLAEQEPTPGLMVAGNFLLGSSLFHLGQLPGSLHCMRQAAALDTGPAESILALFAGPDLGVFCRCYLAHLMWHGDNEPQALAHAAEAIRAARGIHHPFSLAIALNYAAMLSVFRGDGRLALQHGNEAVEICKRYGFPYYLAMANVLTGWAQAAEGGLSDGLAQLRDGMEGMRRLGAELRLPFYFKLLAETLSRAGLIDEALANISAGFAFASKNGEAWAVAGLHLAQGELLAAQGKTDAAQVSFGRGLTAALDLGSLALQRKLSILMNGTPEIAAAERL